MDNNAISRNPLTLWRLRLNMSYGEAAAACGVDKATYFRIERGEKRGSDLTEARIVCATGVSRDQLACIRADAQAIKAELRRDRKKGAA
jgi:transcriptional regulator with XRE-family HTH domain